MGKPKKSVHIQKNIDKFLPSHQNEEKSERLSNVHFKNSLDFYLKSATLHSLSRDKNKEDSSVNPEFKKANCSDSEPIKMLENLYCQNIPRRPPPEKPFLRDFGIVIEEDFVTYINLGQSPLQKLIEITQFPDVILKFSHLKSLRIRFTHIPSIPDELGNLASLEYLDLSFNRITIIPNSIFSLSELKVINLSHNAIADFSYKKSQLLHLESLDLSSNNLTHFPQGLENSPYLKIFDLSQNLIPSIPNSIERMVSLQLLDIHANKITENSIDAEKFPVSLHSIYLSENPLCSASAIPVLQQLQSRMWVFFSESHQSHIPAFQQKFCPLHEKALKIKWRFENKLKGWRNYEFYCSFPECEFQVSLSPSYQQSAKSIFQARKNRNYTGLYIKNEQCPPHKFLTSYEGKRIFTRCEKCGKNYTELSKE